MAPRRYNSRELEEILRRKAGERRESENDEAGIDESTGDVTGKVDSGRIPLIDLRCHHAYRRGHARGSVSIPASRLPCSSFLLPPRHRPFILMAAEGAAALTVAQELYVRGWSQVGWLDGSSGRLDAGLLATDLEPNRMWEPSPWLRRMESRLPSGGQACDLTCDVACGSGRNAVYLAIRGRSVLGVDLLPDALRQGRTLARAARIPEPGSVSFHRLDLRDDGATQRLLRPRRFGLLICFRYLQRDLFPLMATALTPGGWLLYETFLIRQAESGRKPANPAFLLRPGELKRAFDGLKIMDYREGRDEEGNWLASLAARNPV